ncbi:ornithine cyclodeaminase family protein [Syntrophotalea carbinolica DSM 2380]|uniref:Ornithine cyclodeaminase family protein n=1 Tax=Syntrophotalea carbinolica (strain DSM 2380 / NBRC 103641 / GraBd1) TaxID=338963 RepID=Q3A6I3_SYNC1|nr:ornithine cyclodeaminase family protein [Syntrophotalea carbinolica]ABA88024.1 ornithine cyclodeaminase family protein [Syntrophotalea carbinolica DSM 2380]
MALFLNEHDVRQIANMPLALQAVEEALRQHALGRAVNIPRERTRVQKGALHILQGAVDSLDVIGFKAYTSTREGNRFLVHLYHATSGRLEAIIEANFMGMLRTGAASGIASRYLSRPDASVVGLFGAGWQARGQLAALCAVRPIRQAKVFARDRQRLEAFCREQARQLNIEVLPAQDPEQVVRDSDIVTTVTTSATPLFDSEWLTPGCHINAVGSNALIRAEIDEKTIRRCDPVVVDAKDVAARECGDLLPLLEKGRIRWSQIQELGDIIIDRLPGRTSPTQISLFESHGMAIQDLMLAAYVLQQAKKQGLGMDLPFGD